MTATDLFQDSFDKSERIVQAFPPGSATSTPMNIDYRLDKIVEAGILKGAWLDYGCAEGAYTKALVDKGAVRAVGFDVLEDRVVTARNQFGGRPNLEFHYSADGSIPAQDATFDGVFVNEVMEHVHDEEQTLTELNRVLRPGGHIVVISPNRFFPFECHGATIGRHALGFPVPIIPWLPQRLMQRFVHARNYWPSELGTLVSKFGFEVRPLQFVWPVLEMYPWLPAQLIRHYQRNVRTYDRMPVLRKFGVSTMVIGKKIENLA